MPHRGPPPGSPPLLCWCPASGPRPQGPRRPAWCPRRTWRPPGARGWCNRPPGAEVSAVGRREGARAVVVTLEVGGRGRVEAAKDGLAEIALRVPRAVPTGDLSGLSGLLDDRAATVERQARGGAA